MRPLVLELSPPGQFGNATIHAVFGGPIFATSPGENLAGLVFSGYTVDVGSFLLFWSDFRPDQETRPPCPCRVLGELRGGAVGFSKET